MFWATRTGCMQSMYVHVCLCSFHMATCQMQSLLLLPPLCASPTALQIMRFDVSPLPPDQTARPFDLGQHVLLDTAMRAYYAATVAPLPPPPPTAPIREVSGPAAIGLTLN